MKNPIKIMKESYLNRLKNKENKIKDSLKDLDTEKQGLFNCLDELCDCYSKNYKQILGCQKRVREIEDAMNILDAQLKRVRRCINFFS